MSEELNRKEVADYTLFGVEVDLMERFKEFAKRNGIRKLKDALRLLLNLSDQQVLFSHIFRELEDVKIKLREFEVVDEESDSSDEIKTFGGGKIEKS